MRAGFAALLAASALLLPGCIRLKNPPDATALKGESLPKVVVPDKWVSPSGTGDVTDNWLTSFHAAECSFALEI